MISSTVTQRHLTLGKEEKYSALALCHCQKLNSLAPHFWSSDPGWRKGSTGFNQYCSGLEIYWSYDSSHLGSQPFGIQNRHTYCFKNFYLYEQFLAFDLA